MIWTMFLITLLAGTVLPLLAIIVNRLMRKTSASARHRLWTLTVVGLLVFPFTVLTRETPQDGQKDTDVRPPVITPVIDREVFERPFETRMIHGDVSVDSVAETLVNATETAAVPVSVFWDGEIVETLKKGIVFLWLSGIGILLLHYLSVHFRMILFLRRKTLPENVAFGAIIDEIRQRFHLRRSVRCEITGAIPMPITVGVFCSRILFPLAAKDWSEAKIRAVLLHELAHIVRRDLVWQNIVQMACIVYWFQPLVWFIVRHIKIEQELACDDMVLESGQRNSDYASVLLDLSKSISVNCTNQQILEGGLAMIRKKTVVRRIDSILDTKTVRRPVSRRITLAILAATLCFVGIISLFAPKIPLPVFAQTTAVASGTANEESPADFKLGEERTMTIQGKVLLPDGSPAGETFLYFNQLSAFKDSQETQTTDKDGNYTVKGVHVGAYSTAVMTQPQKPGGPVDSLASPVIATIITDPPTPGQFDIQLQKGIKVHGKLIYEDGSPAVDKFINFITYPFGKKNIITHKEANWSSGASFSVCCGATTNDRGEYTKMLVPGEYTVSQSDRFENDTEQSITLTPEEQERRIDLTLPNPTKGQIVLPDGSPAANLQINYISLFKINGCLSSQTTSDKNGNFSLNLSSYGNMLQIVTKDGKFGLVKYIKGDERLKPLTLTLQPPVIGKVRLVSRSGKPVAGLPLSYAPLLHTGENSTNSSSPVHIVTDSDGNAELTQLFVGGEYRLSCRVPDNVHSYPALDIPFNPAIPGEVIDFGEKQIHDDFFQFVTKNSVASGLANNGTVKIIDIPQSKTIYIVDEQRKPIPNAEIIVMFTDGAKPSITAKADEKGKIVLALSELTDGLQFIAFSPFFVPKFQGLDSSTLSDDQTVTLQRGTTIGGIVQDENGQPIPGAKINVWATHKGERSTGLMLAAYKNSNMYLPGPPEMVITDAQGHWTLNNAPPDDGFDYYVFTRHSDYMDDFQQHVQAGSTKVSPEELRKQKHKVVLKSGITYSGKVIDSNGKPVNEALMIWGTDPNDYLYSRINAVRTNQDGNYRSQTLPGGKAMVTIIAEGFSPEFKEFESKPGEKLQSVDFTLKPGKTLEIEFVDAEDKPVPKVFARLGMPPFETWHFGSNLNNEPETKIPRLADENGVYRWTWAPAEAIQFDIFAKDFAMLFNYSMKADGKRQRIVLNQTTKIEIVVKNSITGNPVEKYHFIYGNEYPNHVDKIIWQPQIETVENEKGIYQYEFMSANKDGYRFKIEAEGYKPYTSRVIKLGEQNAKFEVSLKPEQPPIANGTAKAETFCCTVKDENKKPIAGAKVVVQLTSVENSKNTELRLVSGADGSFQFPVTKEQASNPELILHVEAAHPDYISLSFMHEKFSTFRDSYQLADNTNDTAIQLYRSAKVSGTVLTREGKPAASVLVYASSQDKAYNNAQTNTRTDKVGKFVIGTLPGKDRLLWILPNDAAPLSLQLDEKDADLGTLRLQNGVVLEGRAVDADGKPVPNVWLSFLLKDSPGVRRHGHDACCRDAVSDAEGRFRFHPVMPGQYVLDSGFLMEYDRYNSELVPESAYVNLGNVQLWADHPIAQPKLPIKNETIPFVKQEITLTDQAVQKVEYKAPAMFDLTIRTTNDFMKNHQDLKWIVRGEFQGQNWEYEKKPANPAESVTKIKIPVSLKKGYLELWHEVTMAGHYFPLRFRLPKQEKWSNNWYATLGGSDSSLPQSIDVEPYEPGVLKVACFEPDGKPLRQNNIQVKYKNVDFSDPKIIAINGKEIGTGIERHSPSVEFGVLDGLPVMWRYRPVLADEEFTLSADGFNETERFKPVTETLTLKSGEQRELKLKLKEKVEKKKPVANDAANAGG